MRSRWLKLLALLVTPAMVAAAPGGDDDDGTTGGQTDGTQVEEDGEVSAETITIGVLAPTSGPYAEHGELMRMGAELAIDDINEAGGIEALGGAELRLVVEDAGDTVESATSAAQRLFSNDDVVAAMCCWLSSFTLAATEISERQGVPVLTFSFADPITERGYSYVFREDAPASQHVRDAVPLLKEVLEASGRQVQRAALVGDNTAASEAYFAALREQLPGQDIEIILDEVWTPPLPDANQLARQVAQAEPDIIFNGATTFNDVTTLQRAFTGLGVDIVQLGNGAQFVSKEFYEAVGDEGVQFVLSVVGGGVLAGMEDLASRFEERFGTFMIQDSANVYAETWILKEAMELAGSAERDAIRDALSELSLEGDPPASYVPGGRVDYDETGQNIHATVAIQAWVEGRPVTIAPADQAVAELELPS